MADKLINATIDPQTQAGIPQTYQDQGDGSYAAVVTLSPLSGAPDGAAFTSPTGAGLPLVGLVATSDVDPPLLPSGSTGISRMDNARNLYTRSSYRDVAANAYATIIDNIGATNLKLLLPLWEQQHGPFRPLLGRNKSYSGWGNLTLAQPGGLHGIPSFDGLTSTVRQDPMIESIIDTTQRDNTLTTNTFLLAQKFTPTVTDSVGFVRAKLQKVGAPTGNVVMSIYSDNAGVPNAVITNGASSAIAMASITTSSQWIGFSFPTAPVLLAGTTYYLVLSIAGATVDVSNYIGWYYDAGAAELYGLPRFTNTGAWAAQAGQAFTFGIWDNRLQVPSSDFSIIVGFKSNQTPLTNGYVFFLNSASYGAGSISLRISSTNTLVLNLNESTGTPDGQTFNVLPGSEYCIFVLTFSYSLAAAKVNCYLDGLPLPTHAGTATTGLFVPGQPLCIGGQLADNGGGSNGLPGNLFQGLIGPFIFCASALTATQVGQVTNQLLALRRYQEAI